MDHQNNDTLKMEEQKYQETRGPWTAMLAQLKVEETEQNHKHFQTCKKILNCCNIPGNGIIC